MMRSERGFTLIELLVAISVISILLVIAVSQFNSYTRKNKIETQIRKLQADLLSARSQALFQKSPRYVEIAQRKFLLYSTSNYSGVPLQQSETFPVPVVTSVSRITYETTGMGYVNGAADGEMIICAEPSGTEAAFDSLVVTMTFVRLGKRDSGGTCTRDKITLE